MNIQGVPWWLNPTMPTPPGDTGLGDLGKRIGQWYGAQKTSNDSNAPTVTESVWVGLLGVGLVLVGATALVKG